MALPVALGVASSVVQAGRGIFGLISSIRKNREARKILRNTKRPVYNRQREVDEVYDLAANDLAANDVRDYVTNQAGTGLSQAIDAIIKSGGAADFQTIYSNYGDTLERGAMMVSQDRSRRIANYNNAAYNLAKAKDTEFQYNKDAPFKDAMRRANALKGESAKELNSFFENTSGALANAAIAFTKPGDNGLDGTGMEDMQGGTAARRVGGTVAQPTVPNQNVLVESARTPINYNAFDVDLNEAELLEQYNLMYENGLSLADFQDL